MIEGSLVFWYKRERGTRMYLQTFPDTSWQRLIIGAAFTFVVGVSRASAELQVTVSPPAPTSVQVFNLSSIFYDFHDTGQRLFDQSYVINGDQIDVDVVMEDLHCCGRVFTQVLVPGGGTLTNLGPLPAGTYHVDSQMWIRYPSNFPPFSLGPPTPFANGSLTFEVLAAGNSGIPGDYNGDGTVNTADYSVWRNMRGQSGEEMLADGTGPDGTPDGVVDQLDYDLWKAHFGESSASATSSNTANVPEPNFFMCACIAITIVVSRKRLRF